MSEGTSNNRAKSVYPAEQWPEARSLYEGGLSLQGVAGKLGIPYSTVRYHAWTEDWGVRSRGGRQGPRYQAAKAKQIRKKLEKEEKRLEQELALVKAEDLELLARKSLAADSARAKVAVSRRVTEILSRLADPTIPVRSAVQALGSLASILRLVYGWGREPDLQQMKRAGVSYYSEDDRPEDLPPTAAVNLGLIATTPQQLAEMAEAKFNRDDPEEISETECNGQGMGPSTITPEQPRAASHCPQIPKKEAPKPPLEKQPAHPPISEKPQRPPDWFERIAHPAPLAQSAVSPQERRGVDLEELDRLRAEWRGRS
jgi:hypothetical protein